MDQSPRLRALMWSRTPRTGVAEPGGRQWTQTTPPHGYVEGAVGAGGGAAGAVVEGGCPAREHHGAQQVCVEDEFVGAAAHGDGAQGARGEGVQAGGGRALFTGQALGGFQDRAGGGVAAVVGDDVSGVGLDRVHLGDGVEVAAGMQLDVDVGEGFQAGPEFGPGAAHPLATARTSPYCRVSSVTMRSASPSLCWRSTTA